MMTIRPNLKHLFLLLGLIVVLPALAAESYWEYTFRPGDTVWNIAQEYTTDVNHWAEIQRINGIQKDRQIKPGTRIKIPVSMLKRQPTPARVMVARGASRLLRGNGEAVEVTIDSKIFSGDSIITGPGQSLWVRMADGSTLEILQNSEIHFDKLSYHGDSGMVDTRMRLPHGRITTQVQKLKANSRYQIQTPAAITAVRGTAYRMTSEADGSSRTEVTEGSVAVSAGGITREIEQGFGIIAEQGKPLPEPSRLLDPPTIGIDLARGGEPLQINWMPDPQAVGYRYQIASDAEFNQIIQRLETTETQLQLAELKPGDYFISVRAIDRNRLQGLESTFSFRISPPVPRKDTSLEQIIIPSGLLLLGQ